jgi:hypothetical protein
MRVRLLRARRLLKERLAARHPTALAAAGADPLAQSLRQAESEEGA